MYMPLVRFVPIARVSTSAQYGAIIGRAEIGKANGMNVQKGAANVTLPLLFTYRSV